MQTEAAALTDSNISLSFDGPHFTGVSNIPQSFPFGKESASFKGHLVPYWVFLTTILFFSLYRNPSVLIAGHSPGRSQTDGVGELKNNSFNA